MDIVILSPCSSEETLPLSSSSSDSHAITDCGLELQTKINPLFLKLLLSRNFIIATEKVSVTIGKQETLGRTQ